MLKALLGKKIGMTQVFDQEGKVIPVTVIDMGNWVVTQIKTNAKDGYSSLQLGLLKKKFEGNSFSSEWLKTKKNYFASFHEVPVSDGEFSVGQQISFDHVALSEGEFVAVSGKSRGLGFQGVVKRWGFRGGPATHGSKFHRRPGAMGHMRSQGEVIKGKRLPGNHGNVMVTIKGLRVVKLDKDSSCLFVKGAIPGKKDSVVMIKKQGS
jgi:large subunit ribosomal protein L3